VGSSASPLEARGAHASRPPCTLVDLIDLMRNARRPPWRRYLLAPTSCLIEMLPIDLAAAFPKGNIKAPLMRAPKWFIWLVSVAVVVISGGIDVPPHAACIAWKAPPLPQKPLRKAIRCRVRPPPPPPE
jgi:hypothetical protein